MFIFVCFQYHPVILLPHGILISILIIVLLPILSAIFVVFVLLHEDSSMSSTRDRKLYLIIVCTTFDYSYLIDAAIESYGIPLANRRHCTGHFLQLKIDCGNFTFIPKRKILIAEEIFENKGQNRKDKFRN